VTEDDVRRIVREMIDGESKRQAINIGGISPRDLGRMINDIGRRQRSLGQ